ncbi:MAG TPA: ScyD/ScyE family protein [Flexivirga sp.]|uniref:ScyD/ScyE family protein n=1 Tax=Flexivirga sp. TaxID=1962927 RepID=UPI002BAD2352|nr:ScyD/ScyE family protein [Flexivirga sp.]HWC24213.1 ScyD/ScyE family protein [Flexivirga sp.]
MRHLRSLAVGGAAVGLAVTLPGTASANPKPSPPVTLSSSVGAPFNLEVDGPRVLIADGGPGYVGMLSAGGTVAPVVTGVPGAAGVATRGAWLAYTSTVTNEETFENTASGLHVRRPGGGTIYADTTAYEAAHNPDGMTAYGPRSDDPCVTQAVGPRQSGGLDSHAYSVASNGTGWLVADAGANDLLAVSDDGAISTVATFPAQPKTITAAQAEALGMPACVAGVTYDFEPVPTDVEVGPGGSIYVTTLPGGPEGPELGARGSLWKVNPSTHSVTRIATGFAGATNLAIGKHGDIYVAELFGGKISVVNSQGVSTLVNLPGVVSVETAANGTVYAGTMGMDESNPGSIVKIAKGKIQSRQSVR